MWSLIAVAVNLGYQCLKTIQDGFMLTSVPCGFVVIRQSSKDQGAFSFVASPFSRSSASSLLGEDGRLGLRQIYGPVLGVLTSFSPTFH